MATNPIMNIADVSFKTQANGERFEAKVGTVAALIGAKKIGCRVVVVPPGKRAWPYHLHYVNEEFFFVLEGEGELRYDGQTYPVRSGDFIAIPAGPDTAHQLINSSDSELKYLALSTMEAPDVFEYPDSGKFGVFAGAAPGDKSAEPHLAYFGRLSSAVDYWDGED